MSSCSAGPRPRTRRRTPSRSPAFPRRRCAQLARDFAAAPSATAYGRTGSCLGRHATLVGFLLDALSLVTGNLDRAGGTLFSRGVIPAEEFAERGRPGDVRQARSRLGGFPDVLGSYPAALMADEITTPGQGQLQALFVTAGNPVLTIPNGAGAGQGAAAARPAWCRWTCTSTTPTSTPTTSSRHDLARARGLPHRARVRLPTPFVQPAEPVLEAYGEARQEWEVIDEIAKRAGIGLFLLGPLRRLREPVAFLDRRGIGRLDAAQLIETLLRLGPYGDRFGLRRGGLNAKKLRNHPHGIVLAEYAATGSASTSSATAPQGPPRPAGDRGRAGPARRPARRRPGVPAAADRAARAPLPELLDAQQRDADEGRGPPAQRADQPRRTRPPRRGRRRPGADQVPARSIETLALVTDEVGPGTVAVPHGWGHAGGWWERANKAGGANVNELTSTEARGRGKRRALGVRDQMGRRARDRVRAGRAAGAARAQRPRRDRALPGAAAAGGCARRARGRARRRGRRVRRRAAELPEAAGTHAPDLRARRAAARARGPGAVHRVRPALPRRPLADWAALRRAPRRTGRARAGRPDVAGAGAPRRRRRGAARADARPAARGRDREAAGRHVPAGTPLDGLGQGQEHLLERRRDRRLAAGRGRPLGAAGRARDRHPRRRRHAALRRARRDRVHPGRAGAAGRAAGAARARGQPVHGTPAAEADALRRAASWSRASTTTSAPRRARCASRPTRACATTWRPRTSAWGRTRR